MTSAGPKADFSSFEVLSFDCYGTLIDWETGILAALKPVFARRGAELSDAEILRRYADLEASIQARGYRPYREVLREVVREFGRTLRFEPTPTEARCLEESLPGWSPFPDTVDSLKRLKSRYRLMIVSNIDDDLFAATAGCLEVKFDEVVTAQQAGAYKPSLKNFHTALSRAGVPPNRVLHVAQSLYHDILPAKQLGMGTVWVNRARARMGRRTSPASPAPPDLEVPDLRALVKMSASAGVF